MAFFARDVNIILFRLQPVHQLNSYTLNDICLMRFIELVYGQDLEGIEVVDVS